MIKKITLRNVSLYCMSEFSLDIEAFLNKAVTIPVIDVRSPGEFKHAHIPGALNLPVFNNEERSVIGTLYIQKGSSEAISKGLEFIRPKMNEFLTTAWQIAPHGEALIHCWRGGMRSKSMAWLFNTIGIESFTLAGGYRAYRKYILDFFGRPLKLVVIGGMTGSGKTKIIEELERAGKQIIHLERLASHKGSVFGSIGMDAQPATEQFENDLFCHLKSLDPDEPVFIEDESISIGHVFIPRALYQQMCASTVIDIHVPAERRIRNLVSEYSTGNDELLKEGVRKIKKRLGLQNADAISKLISERKYEEAAERMLFYYDKCYARDNKMQQRKLIPIEFNGEDFSQIIDQLIQVEPWKLN